MVKPKIACYITGGWTECGYMTKFLEKINDRYDYRQRFPQKNIGKKGKARKDYKVAGTTGAALVREACGDMRRHSEVLREYSGILIEDDLDDQYFLPDGTGRDHEKIEVRKAQITAQFRSLLKKEDMPVIFLYALPEIEAWFCADWENTFGAEYSGKLSEMNAYFSITFKKYVDRYVLTERFSGVNIENYGFFNGQYKKLSEELIGAFQEYSCQSEDFKSNELYNKKINGLIRNNELRYSKKVEGINMLRRLRPETVAISCGHYFARACNGLRDLHS